MRFDVHECAEMVMEYLVVTALFEVGEMADLHLAEAEYRILLHRSS